MSFAIKTDVRLRFSLANQSVIGYYHFAFNVLLFRHSFLILLLKEFFNQCYFPHVPKCGCRVQKGILSANISCSDKSFLCHQSNFMEVNILPRC